MAFVQGNATNFLDFYNKLRNFLTTNPTLVGQGQAWTQIAGNTGTLTVNDAIVLSGPGLTGTDQVRVRLRPSVNAGEGRYNIVLQGLPNWNAGLAQDAQFNVSPIALLHLWNNAMDYTFKANGRHFVAVAQVTSVVQACYAGFGLPVSLPSEYPYPMAIGGGSNIEGWTYSVTDPRHSHFVCPDQSLHVYTPNNAWVTIRNYQDNYNWQSGQPHTTPYTCADRGSSYWEIRNALASLRKCFGGDYPLIPIGVNSPIPTRARLMDLEGCFFIPGVDNSHGSTITDDGVQYTVVQNVFRTDNFLGYWALRLD